MKKEEVISKFQFEGKLISAEPYGNGHINDTFLVECQKDDKTIRYMLQKLNTKIFTNFKGLMSNIVQVTDFLKNKIKSEGGDDLRECLTLIPTIDNEYYVIDGKDCWRAYIYIENTIAYQIVDNADIFADSGRAFGKFIAGLDGFDASRLCEVIPNFHNTIDRYDNFIKALDADVMGRKHLAESEINFVLERKDYCNTIVAALEKHEIPLRVTHNDTKLNNVLIDATSGKAICVIDLDTIMPGSLLYDFGDSVRFGCSTALEDEKDLSKVNFDLNLYDAFSKGFLEGIKNKITPRELDMLHIGSVTMTFECGMRFLTDFLNGDTYFKTAYADHNLVRCRTQFKLVSCMESLSQQMLEIAVKHYVEIIKAQTTK